MRQGAPRKRSDRTSGEARQRSHRDDLVPRENGLANLGRGRLGSLPGCVVVGRVHGTSSSLPRRRLALVSHHLLPVLGLVQVGIQPFADRYSYVPLIGIYVMIVFGLDEGFGAARIRRFCETAGRDMWWKLIESIRTHVSA